MKRSKYTESQIIKALKENEQGRKAEDICRELGIHKGTFYNWRKKYSGMDLNQLKKLKQLEAEHSRLKKMYAKLLLVHHALKDAIEKKL